jgi:hypothetical protein
MLKPILVSPLLKLSMLVDVDHEKRKPKDGSWDEIYGPKAVLARHRDQTMCHKPIQFDSA